MSSEKEESTKHGDEPNTNSDANIDQSEDQKGNGLGEHAKPKRRRRGKKRKQRKESAATCEAENHEECENELHAESDHENQGECDSPEWGSDDSLNCNYDGYSDVMIRPINVPKAPLNSTQFIMDDHDDCRFYMSFERSPNSYHYSFESHLDGGEGDIIEPIGEDAAYIDIDYQYESPQDFDNSAYYDKEFELSYKNNRFEELMRLSRNDLITRLQTLESRFKELNEDYTKENPSPILEKLQTELLELQEKNSYLKEYNSKLTTLLHSETDCSNPVSTSNAFKESTSVSNDEQESEESEKEVYKECYQSVDEVVMSEINPDSETTSDACDKNTGIQFGESVNDCKEDDCDQVIHHSEDFNQMIDSNEKVDQNKEDIDLPLDQGESESKLLLFKKSEECASSSTAVINSEDKIISLIHSNSHSLHRQQNNLAKEDLRTRNISSSDLFHIANQTKCSSSVPREGGMSPSETSVN